MNISDLKEILQHITEHKLFGKRYLLEEITYK